MNFWWILLLLAIVALVVVPLLRRPRNSFSAPDVSAYCSLVLGTSSYVLPRSLNDRGTEAEFPVNGPIESGDWVFVRGVHFSEKQLQSQKLKSWLSKEVREYFEQMAPRLSSFSGSKGRQARSPLIGGE